MMKNRKYLKELCKSLIKIKNESEMHDFLEGILTPKELMEIPTRLQIIKKLKEGVSQHEIAKELGIGVATVTRGSKELQKGKFKNI